MVQVRITTNHGANRLGYERPFEDFIDLTDQLAGHDSEKAKQLAIINRLLAEQREHAWDHEHGGAMFHGAAILRTESGQWFLSANTQLQSPETTRSCAEANAAIEARGREGKDMHIAELWFMGGKANYERGEAFLSPTGQRFTPCGSCLDIIHNHRNRVGPETVVHMVPLNDGKMQLLLGNPEDIRPANEIEPNRVFSRYIRMLLPNVSYQLSDANGSQKHMMIEGYEWIRNPSNWQAIADAIQNDKLLRLKQLEEEMADPNERLNVMNSILMETARDYYQKSRSKPHILTIAIIRATDGKYYIGKYTRDRSTPASPDAEFEAIGNMIDSSPNKRITDVFIANFNDKELGSISSAWSESQSDDISLHMPNGATREIIKKYSPRSEVADKVKDFFGRYVGENGANVHVFLSNNPELKNFDPQKHVISFKIKDLIPYGYQNPKNGGASHGEGRQ